MMRPLELLHQLLQPLSNLAQTEAAAASPEVSPKSPTNGSIGHEVVSSILPTESTPAAPRQDSQAVEHGTTQMARLMAGYFGARTEEALAPLFETLARAMVEEVSTVVRGVRDGLAGDLAGLRESAATTQRECSRMGREVMRAGGAVDEVAANVAQLAATLRRFEADLEAERDNVPKLTAMVREAVWSETLGDILATLDGLEAALAEARAIASALTEVRRQIDDPATRRWWRAMGEASGIKRPLPGIPVADVESWLQGMELTHRRLREALMRRGVVVIEAIGQPFDPLCHEAVAVEPCPAEEDGAVLRVERNGYRRGEAIVRLAQVVVGKPEPPAERIRPQRKETSSERGATEDAGRD